MKYLLNCLLAVLFLYGCKTDTGSQHQPNTTTPGSVQNKHKLFIIGGGKRPPALVNLLCTEAGLFDGGYGILLPMSSSEPDSAIWYGLKQFEEQGLQNVTGMDFAIHKDVQDSPQLAAKLDSVRGASLIYITGGDQNRFMQHANALGVADAIREAADNGAVVAGTSAGAAVMTEKMITGDEKNYPDYEETNRHIESDNIILDKGLGLINTAIVDQHFIIRGRQNRLLTLAMEYPDLLGIGIDESTAILVNGDSAEVVGKAQVLVFEGTESGQVSESGLLGAQNITVDIYLPGERFSIVK